MEQSVTIDGQPWIVERRHEMAQLMTRASVRERKLYLFFQGPGNELRRNEIPEDFPLHPTMSQLETVWKTAETIRPASLGEMQSQAGLAVPSIRNILKLMWRAVRLQCPHCGGKGILKSWFTLKSSCLTCGLRLERGESQDYYLGGMMFNIILAEFLFVIGFVVTLFVMWPNVPWEGLEYILAAVAVLAPIVLYPFSKLIWLAFDLLLRPMSVEELRWHRANKTSNE